MVTSNRRAIPPGHNRTNSSQINQKAHLCSAYQELGKELGSEKLKVVGSYTLGKVIGEGSFGAVHIATHRLTGTRVAIKKIPKHQTGQLTREIHHHRSLHHEHILQLYEIIATESHIWLVTELCTGGELFDYLVERGRLFEGEARRVFGELTVAVGTMHRHGTVHRDLKLENVFLDGFCGVKLGDLGFAREWTRGSRLLETFCGTTGYASPEMLRGQKYAGQEVDIWSLGIILYTLLCGGLPFDDEDDDEEAMKALILKGEYENPEWLSDEAKDLIASILQQDPSQRLTIEQILSHPWFKKHINDPPRDTLQKGPTDVASSVTRSHSHDGVHAPSVLFDNEATPTQGGALRNRNNSVTFSPLHSRQASPDAMSHMQLPSSRVGTEHYVPDALTNGGSTEGTSHDNIGGSSRHENGFQGRSPSSISFTSPTDRPREFQLHRLGDGDLEDNRRHSGISMDENGVYLPVHSRTPARTKRRSVSSSVAAECRPSIKHTSSFSLSPVVDYLEQLTHTPPAFFSTPAEKDLLQGLEVLGFDTGQMKHSVDNDACDCSAATWWILRAKQQQKEVLERYRMQEAMPASQSESSQTPRVASPLATNNGDGEQAPPRFTQSDLPRSSATHDVFDRDHTTPTKASELRTFAQSIQGIDLGAPIISNSTSSPRRPSLNPEDRAVTVAASPMIHNSPRPSQAVLNGGSEDSHTSSEIARPATSIAETHRNLSPPNGMEPLKPADESSPGGSQSSPGKKPDNGGKGRTSSISMLQRATSALSTGLVRKKSDEKLLEDTAANKEQDVRKSPSKLKTSPLWRKEASLELPPVDGVPEISLSSSQGTISSVNSLEESPSLQKGAKGGKRESLLMTFRSWWNEDRKKRKRNLGGQTPPIVHHPVHHAPGMRSQHMLAVKRTTVVQRRSPADARPHLGSRRSSSIHSRSRRSSMNSTHLPLLDLPIGSPMDSHGLSRRHSSRTPTGCRTPSSEVGEFGSRPSSIHSVQIHGSNARRRSRGKARSIGSTGSRTPTRSPGGPYVYRSSSSASNRSRALGGPHHRSASIATTASNRSGGSSRRSSVFLDERGADFGSESALDDSSIHTWRRRSVEERIANPTILVAKRTKSPLSAQYTVPVRMRPLPPIRDVFADKSKHGDGDDDWVSDEEPSDSFAGGLGQSSSGKNHYGGGRMTASAQDSPTVKGGQDSAYPSSQAAFPRGAHRTPAGRNPDTKQTPGPPHLEPVVEEAQTRAAARGGRGGVMPTNRPADITEEEEPEEDE